MPRFSLIAVVALSLLPLAACKTREDAADVKGDETPGDAPLDVNQTMGKRLIDNCKGCHHSGQFYTNWLAKWSPETRKTAECLYYATTIEFKMKCLEATREDGSSALGAYRAYLKSAEVKGWVDTAAATMDQAAADALRARYETIQEQYMKPKKNISDSEIKDMVDWLGTNAALNYVKTQPEGAPSPPAAKCEGTSIGPEVRAHLVGNDGKLKGLWAKKNREEAGMKMFACAAQTGAAYDPAAQCFQDGKKFPVYTHADTVDVRSDDAKAAGVTLKRVWDLTSKRTAYWTRSSPDGRFVGNGMVGEVPEGGDAANPDLYGIIDDVERKRTIRINAMYDPGFSPDGKWFTFHGSKKTEKVIFCPMSLLTGNKTEITPEDEPRCITRTADGQPLPIAEYHSMATALDQPVQMVAQGAWEDDNGGNVAASFYNNRVQTAQTDFGENTLNVYAWNDEEQQVRVAKQFTGLNNQGDFMISPSSRLVIGRFGAPGETKHLGYKVHVLDVAFENGNIKDVSDKTVGTLCTEDAGGKLVFGAAKVQYSYDERFIVTHHYNPRYTPASGDDVRTKESSSDVFVYDLLTGKALQVTATPPGVYALYPHFRNDGLLYFLVRTRDDAKCGGKDCPDSIVVSDAALVLAKSAAN